MADDDSAAAVWDVINTDADADTDVDAEAVEVDVIADEDAAAINGVDVEATDLSSVQSAIASE